MIERAIFVIACLATVPAAARAGTLYGTVRLNSQPAGNLRVAVACPSFERQPGGSATATSDARGGYTLRVAERGRCEMRTSRDNRAGAPFPVFVSDNPVQYDFEVDANLGKVR